MLGGIDCEQERDGISPPVAVEHCAPKRQYTLWYEHHLVPSYYHSHPDGKTTVRLDRNLKSFVVIHF